jgi:2-dehydro-3-deoxyphosphogalactonate aldolase
MDLKRALADCPLIAILRGIRPHEVDAIGDALHEAGISMIEVPLNSPDPFASIARLADRFARFKLIGAGTVKTPNDVRATHIAGGNLVVMPHGAKPAMLAAKSHGMVACPGFFTPTEAFAMLRSGADMLKLFPSEAASPAVLRSLLAVLPKGTRIAPVGGVDASNIAAWRDAGAAAFGVGSAIYKPGDTAQDVAAKAKALLAALA